MNTSAAGLRFWTAMPTDPVYLVCSRYFSTYGRPGVIFNGMGAADIRISQLSLKQRSAQGR